MKFGSVPVAEAEGGTAVHSIRKAGLVLKKGTLIGSSEVAALRAAGIGEVVVARLEPGDVSEDQAAAEIASTVAGEGVRVDRAFTGRANLFAEEPGVLVVDKTAIGEKEITSEVERYIVSPGQACAYKIGMLKLQELRARAQQELGPKFDQREFHEAVLKNGALPLDILDEQVNDYIRQRSNL